MARRIDTSDARARRCMQLLNKFCSGIFLTKLLLMRLPAFSAPSTPWQDGPLALSQAPLYRWLGSAMYQLVHHGAQAHP